MDFIGTRLPASNAPVAVIDIGSNSIRLVVYEAAVRSPTLLFNEKILCGLGRKLASTGRLSERAVERALAALRRFHKICDQIGVKRTFAIATEAVRRAENGQEFISRAEHSCRSSIRILKGDEEAQLAAAGIAAGFVEPDGIAGDLGGGSLELIDISRAGVRNEISAPIGSLNLMDIANGDMDRASSVVMRHLDTIAWLADTRGRPIYAIGGTWRSVARLHMLETGYPLSIVQHYTMTAKQLDNLYTSVIERRGGIKESLAKISADRREMLPYGLLVLKRLADRMRASGVVFSAFGVREGLIYGLLGDSEKERDPLIVGCEEMASRRARSPGYGQDLFQWTTGLFKAPGLIETREERRLRLAACLLNDVGWRGHPDYRGEKVLGLIAQSSLVGVTHQERAFLALTVYYNHQTGLTGDFSPALRKLINRKWNHLAKVIAMAARTANRLSGNMQGIINDTALSYDDGHLVLHIPRKQEALDGESLRRRFKALAQLLNCEPEIRIESRRRPARFFRALEPR